MMIPDTFTPQELFDFVAAHLRQQKSKSMNNESACAYRGDNGRKCAVGCVIKDEEYSPWMEGKSVVGIASHISHHPNEQVCLQPLYNRLVPHVNLLCYLQTAHDDHEVGEWELRT
jgi:hypothetical protein